MYNIFELSLRQGISTTGGDWNQGDEDIRERYWLEDPRLFGSDEDSGRYRVNLVASMCNRMLTKLQEKLGIPVRTFVMQPSAEEIEAEKAAEIARRKALEADQNTCTSQEEIVPL